MAKPPPPIALLRRLSDRIDRAVLGLSVLLVAAMFAVSLAAIATQFATGAALAWANPVARLFVPWIAMLSLTVAFKRGEHIAMAMLPARLPPRVRAATVATSWLAVALFAAALAVYGVGYCLDARQLVMISDTVQVSQRWVAAAVPVAGAVLCVHLADGAALLGTGAAPGGEGA